MTSYRIGIIIFDEFDLMDVAGPKEVFGAVRTQVSGRQHTSTDPALDLYRSKMLLQVDLLSIEPAEYVISNDGIKIIPDRLFQNISLDDYSVIVVPGGKGVHSIKNDKSFIVQFKEIMEHHPIVLSVCTGAYALAETGIMNGRRITTHQRHHELFKKLYPQINLEETSRVIREDNFIITSGVTAGIDGALFVVAHLYSMKKARQVAQILNYPWNVEDIQ